MNPIPLHNEQELFRQIAEGDEQAFATIFYRYKSSLYDYALKITKSADSAEELVQETFLKLWSYRTNLTSIENPQSYIHGIAKNASLDYFRKLTLDRNLQRVTLAAIAPGSNTTLEELDRGEAQRLLQEALDKLPPQQREVFRLSRYEGLPYAGIGEQMGITSNTVRNHLVQALKTIREYLTKNYGGPVALIIMNFLTNRI